MTSPPPQEIQRISEGLREIRIGDSRDDVRAPDTELNTWQDQVPESVARVEPEVERTPHLPDPSSVNSSTTADFHSELGQSHTRASEEILQEFDPLASSAEKATREAWSSTSKSSLPSISGAPSNSTSTQTTAAQISELSPSPSAPTESSSPAPTFPALAAIARSFSLPLGNRSRRPRSLDVATVVPSPSTLSSLVQQQRAAPAGTATGTEGNDVLSSGGSGGSTPGILEPERTKGGAADSPPFDFQRFLDQMKLKGAEPVAKYLRSFLSNFAKRTFTVNDQVKLINDFLNFISDRMRETDIWRNASTSEFDNAMEGMEKLVMNRLYDFTFTPQVVRMVPPRPVTVDDLEKDHVLSQRIALFQWIQPKHLDVLEGEGSEGFLLFAQQELIKVNHYKAPRDKLICILNCCKVIFGMIRHLRMEENADAFVPILIYVVLKANPPHLLSNVEFISRFRNPAKLQSEAGYYLSSLMGAVSFIETMDHTSLSSITQEEFERNVEEVIQSLSSTEPTTPESATPSMARSQTPTTSSASSSHSGEESAQLLALPTPAQAFGQDARRFLQKTGDTFSKPLSAISRIFNEVLDNAEESLSSFAPVDAARSEQQRRQQIEEDRRLAQTLGLAETQASYAGNSQQSGGYSTPYQTRVRRVPTPVSPSPSMDSFRFGSSAGPEIPARQRTVSNIDQRSTMSASQSASAIRSRPGSQDLRPQSAHVSRTPTPSLDLVGLQDEIDRAHERAAVAARETLKQIFPTTDPEIMEWVLEANEGDLGKSIEALLEMNSGT
ncbi:uncharacterized protein LAESUDRAFT_651751 [Laetiporus sulphureus 93-53]|uniref:VPS9 domain-containing protein n=1 Tax=Laetiporus sulphureus 93-53 TaxID=1314785 RepID=A0A165ELM6_9APHY|nr:uncharacterized protein LAESUDRAFT_651751 [Laetiporus sulphureus 93-53]KZT07314.1 hypothetical protein LAESUDRAFT_651751 [Laetiporus sulphureus 93-53]